jgi:hypothetical protein
MSAASSPVSVDNGGLNGATVQAELVPAKPGRQGSYVRIGFAPGSGSLARYHVSGDVRVRFRKPEPVQVPVTQDFSFLGAPAPGDHFQEWNRVTLYLDGKLVWGREP